MMRNIERREGRGEKMDDCARPDGKNVILAGRALILRFGEENIVNDRRVERRGRDTNRGDESP